MIRLLVILVDGLRYDFISEKDTPYLYGLGRGGFRAPLESILGYSDAIRATIFTSTYPDTHGYWIMYKYSPATSPFKIFNSLKFIDAMPSSFIKSGTKLVISTIFNIMARRKGYFSLSTHNIPFKVIHNFDYTLKGSIMDGGAFGEIPTLFDVLRRNNVKYVCINSASFGWINYFGSSLRIRRKLLQAFDRLDEDVRLIYVYLHHLDNFAHRYGIKSSKFLEELRNMDGTVKLIINEAKRLFGNDLGIIVFSDHGMADTSNYVSFEKLVRKGKFGRDYLFFLDSTMVRLWYLNEAKREKTRGLFERLGFGSFLTSRQREELRINFKHRYYGDDIYLLELGYSIFPNFMSWLKPKSMHAYRPNYESQLGIFIADSKSLGNIDDIKFVRIVDIMPTILDALNLEIPETCEGRALLY